MPAVGRLWPSDDDDFDDDANSDDDQLEEERFSMLQTQKLFRPLGWWAFGR